MATFLANTEIVRLRCTTLWGNGHLAATVIYDGTGDLLAAGLWIGDTSVESFRRYIRDDGRQIARGPPRSQNGSSTST